MLNLGIGIYQLSCFDTLQNLHVPIIPTSSFDLKRCHLSSRLGSLCSLVFVPCLKVGLLFLDFFAHCLTIRLLALSVKVRLY